MQNFKKFGTDLINMDDVSCFCLMVDGSVRVNLKSGGYNELSTPESLADYENFARMVERPLSNAEVGLEVVKALREVFNHAMDDEDVLSKPDVLEVFDDFANNYSKQLEAIKTISPE